MPRKKLFSITASDFRWDYYRGSGSGGQKKNKTENCCRCTHIASGAVSYSEDGRSKEHNRQLAFKKCAATPVFQAWIKTEIFKKSDLHQKVEKIVENELQYETTVFVKDEKDEWVQSNDLSINHYDIKNMKNETT